MPSSHPVHFLVVLLLCAQLTLTVHALEHSLNPDDDRICELCRASSAQGHALGFAAPLPQADAPARAVLPKCTVVVHATPFYLQLIRAPPEFSLVG